MLSKRDTMNPNESAPPQQASEPAHASLPQVIGTVFWMPDSEASPVKVHKMTRLLSRHWDEWRETLRHHIFVAAPGSAARDVTPGDFDSPPTQAEDAALTFSAWLVTGAAR